jgi:hypothetical protein
MVATGRKDAGAESGDWAGALPPHAANKRMSNSDGINHP